MDILQMGKYGFYVWSSFGLTALVFVACIVQAKRRHRRVMHDISRQVQLMESEQ
jgi:heme exporter protein D